MTRTAVVLFNLGGPDSPEAVRPFLFNLFNDPAIIGLPGPLRRLLAAVISRRRAPVAREIYAKLGGSSPLLANTEAQAAALEAALGPQAKVFVAMRYWQPRAEAVAAAVKAWGPEELVLVPLYPQFSTTTSASSLEDWERASRQAGLGLRGRTVCCYATAQGFIAAMADGIRQALAEAEPHGRPRLLLTAHGLPQKIVDRGDPYQWQVERTARKIVAALEVEGLDWVVCYQSRVGPLKWIGPYTDAEIERAGRDGVPVVIAPIAFVSEHSETLVELDIEYAELAARSGAPAYVRVPTVATAPAFIEALAGLVGAAAAGADGDVKPGSPEDACPAGFSGCPLAGR